MKGAKSFGPAIQNGIVVNATKKIFVAPDVIFIPSAWIRKAGKRRFREPMPRQLIGVAR